VSKTKTLRKPKPLYRTKPPKKSGGDFVRGEPLSSAHFELREDGTIAVEKRQEKQAPVLTFRDDARNLWLYQGSQELKILRSSVLRQLRWQD
jgi:hypothetical protein